MKPSQHRFGALALLVLLAACSASSNPASTSPGSTSPAESTTPGNTAASLEVTPATTPEPEPSAPLPPGAVVRFTNLTEIGYLVQIYTLNAAGEAAAQFGVPLKAFGLASSAGVPPAVYRFTFFKGETEDVEGVDVGSCDFELTDSDIYNFVIIDPDIAIASERQPPETSADLLIATSPLCQAEGADPEVRP